jgi:hypothetical protein
MPAGNKGIKIMGDNGKRIIFCDIEMTEQEYYEYLKKRKRFIISLLGIFFISVIILFFII